MNDTMNDNQDRGDDHMTKPPANAVHVQTAPIIGSGLLF